MRFEIDAKPAVWWAKRLRFTWDSDAGTLEGPDAARVEQLVRDALLVGAVQGHPAPRWIPVHDPLHDPADMAALIGEHHVLPKELAARYP